jgi:hypothetical protein
VNDAEFWRAELWRETFRLREALEQQGREYYAARPAYVERYAFVTAYEMRKLEDADALTLDVTDYSSDVLAYPVIKPPANNHDFLLRKDDRKFRSHSTSTTTSSTRSPRSSGSATSATVSFITSRRRPPAPRNRRPRTPVHGHRPQAHASRHRALHLHRARP